MSNNKIPADHYEQPLQVIVDQDIKITEPASMSSTARNFYQNEKRKTTIPVIKQGKFGLGLSARALESIESSESLRNRRDENVKTQQANRGIFQQNNINNYENFNQNISINIQQVRKS